MECLVTFRPRAAAMKSITSATGLGGEIGAGSLAGMEVYTYTYTFITLVLLHDSAYTFSMLCSVLYSVYRSISKFPRSHSRAMYCCYMLIRFVFTYRLLYIQLYLCQAVVSIY
jgi:hypothetical protein